MKYNKRNRRIIRATNAVEPAAPASVWCKGVPGKGGKTLNYVIPEWMFQRELNDMMGVNRNA